MSTVVRCHVLDTGYCLASEHHVMQGGRRTRIACHALVALIEHPQHGWLLWDTGYAPRMRDATQPWPFWLYRLATPLHIQPAWAVVNQLARFGLTPRAIRTVIISHFHADHIAGLRDFPCAAFVALKTAYEDIVERHGFAALRRAFIPALLPDDFRERVRLLAPFTGPPLPCLGPTHDLFGDGSLVLVALPGHASGQIGMLAHTERGQVFFVADGAWLSESIRRRAPPAAIASLIADDPHAVRATLHALHAFAQARPDVTIVPTHCPEVYAQFVVQYGA